ncbi:probable alpha-aspartyl dipeptidase [Condylostylus longicornis]|uniref:probable alpha-aspartyl dipeptidase n=1 Tax=Condylostylus longicornis TaxID=2530218 RepID=UPI00244E1892|nr:probable alpha-aspartyl dipeptidase [Condylostylus longicornis]
MAKRQLLLISSSRVHGFDFLEHTKQAIDDLLQKNNVKTVLFIPYALRDHDDYTKTVSKPLNKWGYNVNSIHTSSNPVDAVNNAEAIFIGGGNTFVLLKTLIEKNLVNSIRKRVLEFGVPYMGSSAGTNVATRSIHTTNDMPVVYPPSFDSLNLVPFNINPHYIEKEVSTHKGESRDQRIHEFIDYNNRVVIGLREGTSLLVQGDCVKLVGDKSAKLFLTNHDTQEYEPGSDLSFLIHDAEK